MYINHFNYNYQMSHMAYSTKTKPGLPKSGVSITDQIAGNDVTALSRELLYNGIKAAQAPKNINDYNEKLRSAVETGMRKLNISLEHDERLELTLGADNLIKVGGLKDKKRAIALEKMLNTTKVISLKEDNQVKEVKSNLYASAFYINSDYAKAGGTFEEAQRRIMLIGLKHTITEDIKRQTGVEVDVSKLYLADDGSIQGLPEELANLFNGSGEALNTQEELSQRSAAASIKLSLRQLLQEGYGSIPNVQDLGITFRFSARDFPAYMNVCI